MSFYNNNKEKIEQGFLGEQVFREYLQDKKVPFMQVDVMYKKDNEWYLAEIKSQEKYINPDGHGLPQWQIDRRMEFQKDTGIKFIFAVYDTQDKCLYVNSMDNLKEQGNEFSTKGKKPRVIFPLESFIKIELNK